MYLNPTPGATVCTICNYFLIDLMNFLREYIQNLKYIDREIHTIYDLFQKFFNDNRTSYVFTSDHGMTDWGSHGSGTDHETQSPFIAWGSGIKGQLQPCDLHQVDTAALISALLGINFPTNSVVRVRTDFRVEYLISYIYIFFRASFPTCIWTLLRLSKQSYCI